MKKTLSLLCISIALCNHLSAQGPVNWNYFLLGDLNTYTPPGLYEYDGQGQGVTNAPTPSPNFRVLSLGNTNRWSQLAFQYGTDNIYFRRNDEGYGYWRQIWHTGNMSRPVYSYVAADLNILPDEIRQGTIIESNSATSANIPRPDTWFTGINLLANSNPSFVTQFGASVNGRLWTRHSFNGTWNDWSEVWTSANFSPSSYLPVTGGAVDGDVTIGTMQTQRILKVNGDIKTRKLKVTQTDWPDYVFDSSYQLSPLKQVQKYIQENKHLPGIPSAATVSKEGIDVGDNQALLLKKIEELTLYIIRQNDEIQEQKKEMLEMKKELNTLKEAQK